MRLTKSVATAASLAIAATCFAGPASAGSWDRGHGWHHGHGWDDDFDGFGAAFIGLATGLILSNAFAPRYYGYGQPYDYGQTYYAPAYPQPYYSGPPVFYDAPPLYYGTPHYGTPLYYAPYREDPSYRSNR
jgi:hypothetical protein